MSTSHVAEIRSLTQELTSFGVTVDTQSTTCGIGHRFTLLGSQCVARSALFIVLDRLTCPEKIGAEPGYVSQQGAKTQHELELQRQSMQVIETASDQLHALGLDVLSTCMLRTEGNVAQSRAHVLGLVSPFIMDSLYAAAATFHWLAGESGKDGHRKAAADLDMVLDKLSSRWRLASAYREMLMVYDVSARVEARMV